MAKIGLKYPMCGLLTDEATSKYGPAKRIAKAIKADVKLTKSDSTLYAEDAAAESDKSVTGGTITLEVDDLGDDVYTMLMGHAKDAETGEITANVNDTAPYVGVGFYGTKVVNNVKKYRALWLKKVQFGEPDDSNETKGESVSFKTPTIEGTIMIDSTGDWKNENTFDTEAEAITYLNGKCTNA